MGYGGFSVGAAQQSEHWKDRDRNSTFGGWMLGGGKIDAAGTEQGFSHDRSVSASYRGLIGAQSGSGAGFNEYFEAGAMSGLWESSKGVSESVFARLQKKGLSGLNLSDIGQGELVGPVQGRRGHPRPEHLRRDLVERLGRPGRAVGRHRPHQQLPVQEPHGELLRCFDLLIDGRSGAQVERLMADYVTLEDLIALLEQSDGPRVRGWYQKFARGRAALERYDGAA